MFASGRCISENISHTNLSQCPDRSNKKKFGNSQQQEWEDNRTKTNNNETPAKV